MLNSIAIFQIASVPTNQLGSSSVLTQTDIGNLRNMYSRCGKTFQFISNNNITIQINNKQFPDSTPSPCQNIQSDVDCNYWTGLGNCGNIYEEWMSTNCKKTCGLCCQNSYPSDKDCKYWSGLGNCANNYAGWMDTNCKSSCGKCCQNTYGNDTDCDYWAGLGYCTQTYVTWMNLNCAAACNSC